MKVKKPEPVIEFIYTELEHEFPYLRNLSVRGGNSIYLVAEKLSICRERGIHAYAVFNGVVIDNFETSDSKLIVEQFESRLDKLRENRNSKEEKNVLTHDQELRLFNIKKNRAKGWYISNEDLEFENSCVGTYEYKNDINPYSYSNKMIMFDNYNKMICEMKKKKQIK